MIYKISNDLSQIKHIFKFLEDSGYIFRILDEHNILYMHGQLSFMFYSEAFEPTPRLEINFSNNLSDKSYSLGSLYHMHNNLELGALAEYNNIQIMEIIAHYLKENITLVTDEKYCIDVPHF